MKGLARYVVLYISGMNLLYYSFVLNVEDNVMRVSPPPPLRTAYRPILALRTAYRRFLASHTLCRLSTKNNHFGPFLLHREDKMTVYMSHQ